MSRFEDRPPQSQLPLILAVVGGLLLLLAGCAVVGLIVFTRTKPGPAPVIESRKTFTREEFKAAVLGKTKDQILTLLGKPDSTSGGRSDGWSYNRITVDPISGKTDTRTWVWFNGDTVDRIDF